MAAITSRLETRRWAAVWLPLCLLLLSSSSEIGFSKVVDGDPPLHGKLPRRMLISGHSLVNRPFPDHLARIAAGVGGLDWSIQYREGSTLKSRTSGGGRNPSGGYQSGGNDRNGKTIDVLHALSNAAEMKAPFDGLLLTEQSSLLESLIWHDTISHVIDYDDRLSAANPQAETYLFSSWLHVSDRANPGRWIDYEMTAGTAWRCTVGEINRRRPGKRPVRLIPAAEGLAALVQQAIGSGVPGLTAGTSEQTMHRLFDDDHHLTALGTYYVALLTYTALDGQNPASGPPGATATPLERELARRAKTFLDDWNTQPRPGAAECRTFLSSRYVSTYLAYVRDTSWRDGGTLKAMLNWARYSIVWPRLLRSASKANPFASTA